MSKELPVTKTKKQSEKSDVKAEQHKNIVRVYKYESEKYLFGSNFSELYSEQLRKESTPSWIVENMIDLLPDSVWNTNTKFLDIYCKSGIFLEVIIDRLMSKVDYSAIDLYEPKAIYKYIIENQVYALCWKKEYTDLTRTAINGKVFIEKNIKLLERDRTYITDKEFRTKFREIFGDMKIDVVVANPPYNSDIYIPFVEMGHQLASTCGVYITPAKWQAKGGEKNEQFRQNIVPYMSKIVYYPCAQEVFDIRNLDGISYYLTTKAIHNKKEIKNISNRQQLFNSVENREMLEQLNNRALSIMTKITNGKKIKISSIDIRHFGLGSGDYGIETGELNVMQGDKCTGHYSIESIAKNRQDIDRYKVVMLHMCGNSYYGNDGLTLGLNKMYINKPNEIQVYDYMPIWICTSEYECKSFISYFNTRLVRFILMMSIVGQTANNEEYWRMVPDPGAFDHIFTDEELYKKYNLTQEEINIIESVIKERNNAQLCGAPFEQYK